MKEKRWKIAGTLIALLGGLDLIIGVAERDISTIIMGLCFVIMGSLYFFEKRP